MSSFFQAPSEKRWSLRSRFILRLFLASAPQVLAASNPELSCKVSEGFYVFRHIGGDEFWGFNVKGVKCFPCLEHKRHNVLCDGKWSKANVGSKDIGVGLISITKMF